MEVVSVTGKEDLLLKMDEHFITKEEREEYLTYHTYRDVVNNFLSGLSDIEKFDFSICTGKCSLICGGMIAFDKGIINFLNKWSIYKDLFLLSEVTAENRRYTKVKCQMPYICTPHLLAKEIIIIGMDIPVVCKIENLLESKRYLKEALYNLKERHLELGRGYAENFVYYAYLYIQKLLDALQPKTVILWNEFYAFHHIFKEICKERKIPVFYMEFGCLPGTLCVEKKGQQGESCVATSYRKFRKKAIEKHDIAQAERCIAYMRSSEISRNIQPRQGIQRNMLHLYDSGRKTILFCGQNDFESGMVPYIKETKKFHSPIFKTSLEAVQYLQRLALKNSWNLIFKPHPIMCDLGHSGKEYQSQIDIVSEVDINSTIDFSDLVITILSQCAYIALIREKPVLMMGYNQLRGKGCSYEAFKKISIEPKIKEALRKGYTEKQKEKFKIHVAQLLKYYLYDDGVPRNVRYGRKIDELSLEDE